MAEKNEKDHLNRYDHLQLEAYRSLKELNNLEARDTMALDAIVVVGGAAWLFKTPTISPVSSIILLVGYVLLLFLWLGLAWRTHSRMRNRIFLMELIEKDVGFCAYRAMEGHIRGEFFILKFPWYRFLIAGCILLVIIVETFCPAC